MKPRQMRRAGRRPSPPPTAEAPATANEAPAPAATVPAKPHAGRQSALIPGADGASAAISPSVLLAIETARQAMAAPIPKPANAATVPEREVTGSLAQPAKPAAPSAPAPASAFSSAHIRPLPRRLLPRRPLRRKPPRRQLPPRNRQQSRRRPAAPTSCLQRSVAPCAPPPSRATRPPSSRSRSATRKAGASRRISPKPPNGSSAPPSKGSLPAHFRLGGLYEKGLGVKKNLDTARRFYLTAGEAGNAKALHNLAVLYAEGIDGKPDYLSAAKWFRKAAGYGVADSQYNLGILYARGIGVEQNLAEAYRWFALAAREGDREAAKKRDDVGARLDERSLTAAQAAVQAWPPSRSRRQPSRSRHRPAVGTRRSRPKAPPSASRPSSGPSSTVHPASCTIKNAAGVPVAANTDTMPSPARPVPEP